MQADAFDEPAFFRAVAESGARALLIGRRAMIALGSAVATFDYDFWIHIDDISPFNRSLEAFDLVPNFSPEEARQRGRYVLENSEHVDVLVARAQPTIDGERIVFDEVWARRQLREVAPSTMLALPSIRDLMSTKRFGARGKDADDLRFLGELLLKVKE